MYARCQNKASIYQRVKWVGGFLAVLDFMIILLLTLIHTWYSALNSCSNIKHVSGVSVN